jgi:hypothetical protein
MGRKTGIDALFRPVRDEMACKTFDCYPYIVPLAEVTLGFYHRAFRRGDVLDFDIFRYSAGSSEGAE